MLEFFKIEGFLALRFAGLSAPLQVSSISLSRVQYQDEGVAKRSEREKYPSQTTDSIIPSSKQINFYRKANRKDGAGGARTARNVYLS